MRIAFALAVSAVILAALAGVCFVGYQFHKAGVTLSSVPALTDPAKAPLPAPISYYSADGVLLGRRGTEQRIVLSPKEIPPVMRQAIVAIEDQRFYEHRGVDFQALARAALIDVRAGSAKQGASTLTMQYIRNVYLDLRKTTHRKLQEVALAMQLESRWTKDRILTAYLNTVFFGEGAYGVEAAARQYFGVHAEDLTLQQASLLAGLVQSPSELDPRHDRKAARARQALVLDEMYAQGMITRRQAEKAKSQPLHLRKLSSSQRDREPALMALLEDEVQQRVSKREYRLGGFNVHASFRMSDIRRAREQLRDAYPQLPRGDRPTVAASFVEPANGRILLLASSAPASSHFDFAAQSRRQPGSTVKAFTAATYLTEGGQLSDPVDNSPVKVTNANGSTYTVQPEASGVRNVFDMLRLSQNPAAWRLFQKAGPHNVMHMERKLGIRGMDANAAAALGGVKYGTNTLEIAGAFAAIANDGAMAPTHAIVTIKDTLGNPIWDDSQLPKVRRLDQEYARQLTVGLQRVVTDGFPQLRANLPISKRRPLAGKTGTTEENADAWFSGYTPQLAGSVWTGYAKDRRSLANLPGGTVWGMTLPAQTFNRLAKDLLDGQPVRRFPKPAGIQRVPDITGDDIAQARAEMGQMRFYNVAYTEQFDAHAKPGTVLTQKPAGGTWVRPDAPVTVTYATDQRPTPMLVGKSYLDAEQTLGSFADLDVTFQVSEQPLGTVIEQQPYVGQPLRYHGKVAVVIATSPGPIRWKIKKVPYVPSKSELAQLRQQLADSQAEAEQARSEAASARSEADQARADADSQPAQTLITVPDLAGLDVAAAQQVIASLGLTASIQGAAQTGAVIAQKPAAGFAAQDGSTVTLRLGG